MPRDEEPFGRWIDAETRRRRDQERPDRIPGSDSDEAPDGRQQPPSRKLADRGVPYDLPPLPGR